MRRRICGERLQVVLEAPSATPDLTAWTRAPPRSSWETTSLVTVFTTSGPVTYM